MTDKKKIAPVVRKLAEQKGIDPNQIEGTGKNGAVTLKDFEAFTGEKAKKEPKAERRSPMNHLTDDTRELEVGGMKFTRSRTSLDHSGRKTVDIPEECKNKDLHYRVVNDDRGKLQSAKNMGYQIVESLKHPVTGEEIDTKFRMGTKKDGSDLYGYLMATPKKWKDERDQQAESERKSREDGMFTKPQDETGNLGGDFYKKKGVDSGYQAR